MITTRSAPLLCGFTHSFDATRPEQDSGSNGGGRQSGADLVTVGPKFSIAAVFPRQPHVAYGDFHVCESAHRLPAWGLSRVDGGLQIGRGGKAWDAAGADLNAAAVPRIAHAARFAMADVEGA